MQHLLRHQLNHCPLLIRSNGFAYISESLKPFRFYACWMSHHAFQDFIVQNWKAHIPRVPALKCLPEDLSTWNTMVFGNLFRWKRKLWKCLEGIQLRLAISRGRHLIKLEAKLRRKLDEVLGQIEILWFQKSRMEAIKDGDRNTRYFYLSTIARRKYNRIESLQVGSGDWITNPEGIKAHVLGYFSKLLHL